MDVFTKSDDEERETDDKGSKKTKPQSKATFQKHVTRIGVCYDENSLAERKEVVRGVATVDQDETIFLVSRDALKMERKPRLKFAGTSAGSRIMPAAVPHSQGPLAPEL